MAGPTRRDARHLDRSDPLAAYRDRFLIADPGLTYLDGNSLGRLPLAARDRVQRAVDDEWGAGLVGSWEEWIDLPQRVGELLAPLIGAAPGETTLADSTSVNLYKLAGAALAARPGRDVIVTDRGNFPTDRYVLESLAASRGAEVRYAAADPVRGPTPDTVADCLDDRVALVSLSHVSYRSGAIAPMGPITEAVHAAGALTLWDLSHAVGAVPIDLVGEGADLAVGCTYKYLNGGPGAPAFLWVRSALRDGLLPPVTGWFGHADQFAFAAEFEPAPGIERFLTGTPPILSVAAARAGIEMAVEAGIGAIRAKSLLATGMMLEMYDHHLAPLGVGLGSPRSPERRGGHLAFRHPEGLAISGWLRTERGVVADFRAPDVIRMAPAPLATSFVEAWNGVEALREAVATGAHAGFQPGGSVT
jgi:kynureninase